MRTPHRPGTAHTHHDGIPRGRRRVVRSIERSPRASSRERERADGLPARGQIEECMLGSSVQELRRASGAPSGGSGTRSGGIRTDTNDPVLGRSRRGRSHGCCGFGPSIENGAKANGRRRRSESSGVRRIDSRRIRSRTMARSRTYRRPGTSYGPIGPGRAKKFRERRRTVNGDLGLDRVRPAGAIPAGGVDRGRRRE